MILRSLYTSTAFLVLSTVSHAQEVNIRITHCLKGICPQGTSAANTIAAHEIFALSSNPETKIADWVAYRPNRETIATTKDLKRTWRTDPILPPESTLEPKGRGKGDDYKHAYKAHNYNRGHLAPLTLFADTEYWRTTNYYSNIAPMKSKLNQGPWAKLELWEKDTSYNDRALYVLTGPIYEGATECKAFQKDKECLPNADEAHSIPTAYWKVITNKTGSKATAFIMPQGVERKDSVCDFVVSVVEVEQATGLTLFPATQTPIESRLNGKLGCASNKT